MKSFTDLRPSAPRCATRAALLAAAAFGLGWAVVEDGFGARFEGRYDLLEVVWCRYGVHLALMLAVWGWRTPALLWRTQRPVFQIARSMLMVVMPLSFIVAVGHGSQPALVWTVFWIAPLLVLAAARVFLKERPAARQWALAFVALLGAALAWTPSRPASLQQLLLPALMALSFGLYVVMTRSLRDQPTVTNLFYTAAGVFVVLTPFVPAIWTTPTPHDALMLVGIGSFGWVSLLALDRACQAAPVSTWISAMPVQVVCVAAVSWLVSRHVPTRVGFVGLAVMVVCAGLAWRWAPVRPQSSVPWTGHAGGSDGDFDRSLLQQPGKG